MQKSYLGSSTASLAGYSLLDAIAEIKRLGFESVEILAFDGARHSQGDLAGFWFNKLSDDEKEALREATSVFQHVSTHLPFIDVPLFSYNAEMSDLAKEQLKVAIEGTGYIGGEAAAIHVYPRHFMSFDEYWDEMVDTFRDLGDHAAEHGVKLGIETMCPNSIRQFAGLISDIDHPSVGATIDVGHIVGCSDLDVSKELRGTEEAKREYNDCLIRVVEAVGEKIYNFHLHDVREADWRDHRQVGAGIIDFGRLFEAANRIGCECPLILELEEPNKVDALVASKRYVERSI